MIDYSDEFYVGITRINRAMRKIGLGHRPVRIALVRPRHPAAQRRTP